MTPYKTDCDIQDCPVAPCLKDKCPIKKKIEQLQAENSLLKQELAELRAKIFGRKQKKEDKLNQEKEEPPPKKRGVPAGHPGWYRPKPEKIDKIVEVVLQKCPLCGGRNLTECKEVETHIQEDILLPQVITTQFNKHHSYCRDCKRVVSGIGEGELPNSQIGPAAKAVAVFMKYDIKVSDRDIQRIFKNLFGLKISIGAIPGFRNQLSRESLEIYEQMKKQLRKSSYVNADETGWRLDGDNQWLWSFSNNKISLYHIDKSRGQKVVKEILSEKYDGVLISDFLSAYNKIETKAKQRCLIHLDRDLKKIMARFSADETITEWCRQLRELLKSAVELHKDYRANICSRNKFLKERKKIVSSLDIFEFPNILKEELPRIAKRIKRHNEELFTFLFHEGIPFHNNHAEQQIRPNVLLRKITFGNRSISGAINHNVLMSIMQTAKLNNRNTLEVFKNILEAPETRNLESIIRPP
jgi:hypothetical protein